MEDIKEKLGPDKYYFFKDMQNYLGTDLLFYGSVKRMDYFKNASDIDIAVLSENVPSTLNRLLTYLNMSKKEVRKIYQNFNGSIVKANKIKYVDEENHLDFDVLIYDIKYEKLVKDNINEINNFPFYMIVILSMIKFIYYNMCMLPESIYIYLKQIIFTFYFKKVILTDKDDIITTIILPNNKE